MQIGNTQISREIMPSFVRPDDIPTHLYSSAQDTLNAMLGMNQPPQMQAIAPQNAGAQSNAWDATGAR